MCSNFGMNLHPGRPPAAIENRVYQVISNWIARVRAAVRRRLRRRQLHWS